MVHGGYKRQDNMIHVRQCDHGNRREAAWYYGDISAAGLDRVAAQKGPKEKQLHQTTNWLGVSATMWCMQKNNCASGWALKAHRFTWQLKLEDERLKISRSTFQFSHCSRVDWWRDVSSWSLFSFSLGLYSQSLQLFCENMLISHSN